MSAFVVKNHHRTIEMLFVSEAKYDANSESSMFGLSVNNTADKVNFDNLCCQNFPEHSNITI
jgi:hypothetical protein